MNKIFLTVNGLENFKKEFESLTQKRVGAVKNISKAREMGDLSENGFYKAARHELSSIDRRLRELTHIIKYSQLIKKTQSNIVGIGSRVTLLIDEKEVEYEIVGKYEANPSQGKLSNESIVGKALLSRKINEMVKVETPNGVVIYKIKSIL